MNPLLKNKYYFYIYTAFWVLVSGTHFIFLNRILNINAGYALADSLVYNTLYYPLGMAVWYVVKFNKIESGKILQLILVQLLSAAVLSFLWVLISFNILILIDNSESFASFQYTILPMLITILF